MNYAKIRPVDIANGPGVRVSVFVSGCPHHCQGCFNPETWDYTFGQSFGDAQIQAILVHLAPRYIMGLSVLGGEPFSPQNQGAVLRLLRAVRAAYPQKDIWAYTGYLFEDIAEGIVGQLGRELLERVDVLVDGPFMQEKKNLRLMFRGSENQRIINVRESLRSGAAVLSEYQ